MPCSCTPETCTCKTRYTLQLINKFQHSDDTFSLDFVSIEPMTWREGDHSNLYVQLPDGRSQHKKFSYATMPEEKVIRFTTRAREPISNYKQHLMGLSVGDFMEVSQPSGHFSLLREDRPVLLLSNGVGIATVRALVKAFMNDPTGINRMIQINVDRSGRIYGDEFDQLSGGKFQSIYADNRFSFFEEIRNATTELLFGTGKMPFFYVVGSYDFVMSVQGHLLGEGFDYDDILLDKQQNPPTSIKITADKTLMTKGKSLKLGKKKLSSAS